MTTTTKRAGGKWISKMKRRAIYFRDGHVCCYCQRDEQTILGECEKGWDMLSLDHITPHVEGGTNLANNLITCCRRCNSSRGKKTILEFSKWIKMTKRETNKLTEQVTKIVCTSDSRKRAENYLHVEGCHKKAALFFKNIKNIK